MSAVRLLLMPTGAAGAVAAAAAPSPLPPPPLLRCELRSAALAAAGPAGALPLPRFGSSSQLWTPIALVAAAPPPLVAAVLLEQRPRGAAGAGGRRAAAGGGDFLVLAGAGAGVASVAAGVLPQPASGAWANLSFPGDGLAMGALLALLAPLREQPGNGASPGPSPAAAAAPLSTLSRTAHLLLLAAAGSSFSGPLLAAQLGGAPCVLNWVAPGGELASFTTPPTTLACGGAAAGGAPRYGICGVAPLQISTAGFGEALAGALAPAAAAIATRLGAAAAAQAQPPYQPPLAVALPFSWPPFAPRSAWGVGGEAAAVAVAGPLLGAPPAAALGDAGGAAMVGGIRVALPCADASLAPLEACASTSLEPLSGVGRCAWGGGDACMPCPEGALCPGGALLLPLPGYWSPGVEAPPSSLVRCAEPFAELRCPGTLGLGGNGSGGVDPAGSWWVHGGSPPCGDGFWGAACASCAPRFFATGGLCSACPPVDALLSQLLPLLRFMGGLAALGMVLLALAYSARRRGAGGGSAGTGKLPPAHRAARDVAAFLAWAWVATQALASQFSLLEDSGALPPRLLPLFSAVASLQFKGIALPPACFEAVPFVMFYAALAVFVVAFATALALVRRGSYGGGLGAVGGYALRLCALVLCVGYGSFAGAAAGALTCLPPAPLPLREYATTAGDGSAARAALGTGAPPWAALVAAASDPAAASSLNLTSLLLMPIPVSLLASNPFQPCREGAHEWVWYAAMAFAAALAVLPPAGLAALGCATRVPRPANLAPGGKGGSARAAAALFAGAFTSPLLRPHAQWWSFYELTVIGFCAAAAALSARAVAEPQFYACQGLVLGASLLSVLLLSLVRPHAAQERWRAAVGGALYIVTAVAAALALALRGRRDIVGSRAWALGLLPGVLAIAVYATLVTRWWQSLEGAAREERAAEALLLPPAAAAPQLPLVGASMPPLLVAQQRDHEASRGGRSAVSQLQRLQSASLPPAPPGEGAPGSMPTSRWQFQRNPLYGEAGPLDKALESRRRASLLRAAAGER